MPLIFSTGEAISALCWTLLHSLWQGLIAAVIAGLIVVCTRRSTARLRYNLLGTVVLLFLAGVAFTFFRLKMHFRATDLAAGAGTGLSSGQPLPMSGDIQVASTATMLGGFIRFCDQYASFLVLAWLCLFLWKCSRLFTGLAGSQRIRHCAAMAPGREWKERLDVLTHSLGIKLPVRLLQSGRVTVPVVVGFLRPVIFLPLGLLAQLPPDQAETILLHELAHVRRHDYIINVSQRLVEAVFFFNPALLWISSLIRQEREACCDDIVVAHTQHKQSYLEALVSFQERQLAPAPFAMALGTKRNYLLTRVRRMLTRENKKLNFMEKAFLLTGLAFITAFSFIPPANPSKGGQSFPQTISPDAAPGSLPMLRMTDNKDTVPAPEKKPVETEVRITGLSTEVTDDGKTRNEITTATDENGKKYVIRKRNNELTELSVDGTPVPSNEIGNHSGILQKIEMVRQDRREQNQKRAIERETTLKENQENRKQVQEERAESMKAREKNKNAEWKEREADMKEERKAMEKERKEMSEEKEVAEQDAQLFNNRKSKFQEQDAVRASKRDQKEQQKQRKTLLALEKDQMKLEHRQKELSERMERLRAKTRERPERKEVEERRERPEMKEKKEMPERPERREKAEPKKTRIEAREKLEAPEQPEYPTKREKKERKEIDKKKVEVKEITEQDERSGAVADDARDSNRKVPRKTVRL